MNDLEQKLEKFYQEFGISKKMVLSTVEKQRVTSRMMSIVRIKGVLYFQTDCKSTKYRQLVKNPYIALCNDNIQIEAKVIELGHPLNHKQFCEVFQVHHPHSYENYTILPDERLFAVALTKIQLWKYVEDKPYLAVYDIEQQTYQKIRYQG
ncbi:MAG: pyridoxamine 5'-phosphate oxidase family protein [Culicoidibacterales bacterium]